jgi:tetratricopeptide (TPR) repeat protein
MGRVDEARDFYNRAVQQDKRWADQAGSDLLHLARLADARSDPSLMTSAVETAVQFLPGLSVEELALPLARQYFRQGQFGRALPYYQRALGASSDSAADVLMEVGTAYEQIGDCGRALDMFERYRGTTRPWNRTEIDWHIGTCSLQLASQRRADGERDEALRLVDRMIELGEPRNELPQAWFDKGEILSDLGQCDAAMDAYRRVRSVDPSGVGALGRRADQRVDEIRFGRGPRQPGGRC